MFGRCGSWYVRWSRCRSRRALHSRHSTNVRTHRRPSPQHCYCCCFPFNLTGVGCLLIVTHHPIPLQTFRSYYCRSDTCRLGELDLGGSDQIHSSTMLTMPCKKISHRMAHGGRQEVVSRFLRIAYAQQKQSVVLTHARTSLCCRREHQHLLFDRLRMGDTFRFWR